MIAIPLKLAISGALLGFIAGAAACSPDKEDSSNDGAKGGSGAEADPMATLVAAICDGLGECCDTQGDEFDRAACEAAARSEMDRREPAGGAPVWHLEVVDQCADVLRTSLSACGRIPSESICDNVYSGAAPTGGACNSTSDCAPVNGAVVSCFVDTCVVERRVGLGESCTATCLDYSCPYFYRSIAQSDYQILGCDQKAGLGCVDGVCAPLPTNGQPCNGGVLCAPGHHCVAGDLLCIADAALGEDCSDRPCAQGSWCSEDTCVALLPNGELCFEGEQCQSGVCNFDETDTELFCLPAGGGQWDATECAGDLEF